MVRTGDNQFRGFRKCASFTFDDEHVDHRTWRLQWSMTLSPLSHTHQLHFDRTWLSQRMLQVIAEVIERTTKLTFLPLQHDPRHRVRTTTTIVHCCFWYPPLHNHHPHHYHNNSSSSLTDRVFLCVQAAARCTWSSCLSVRPAKRCAYQEVMVLLLSFRIRQKQLLLGAIAAAATTTTPAVVAAVAALSRTGNFL